MLCGAECQGGDFATGPLCMDPGLLGAEEQQQNTEGAGLRPGPSWTSIGKRVWL